MPPQRGDNSAPRRDRRSFTPLAEAGGDPPRKQRLSLANCRHTVATFLAPGSSVGLLLTSRSPRTLKGFDTKAQGKPARSAAPPWVGSGQNPNPEGVPYLRLRHQALLRFSRSGEERRRVPRLRESLSTLRAVVPRCPPSGNLKGFYTKAQGKPARSAAPPWPVTRQCPTNHRAPGGG